jgi:hypothetical protein
VHAVLVRCRISRLAHLDRATGQPIRRDERDHPGELVHIDVKKLGNIPAGGGHRFLGRAAGGRNRQADRSSGQRSRYRNSLIGHGFIHAAVDDHSRLAYAEIHPDERSQTAAGFLTRAQAWFAARGVVIQRVLTDNGSCYRSHQAKLPAGPPSDPGCTGITTTGPTAHSEVAHPSPAAPTSPSLTPRKASRHTRD